MNPAHRVRRAWSQTSLIVMRKKLGLVRGHVDLDRTLAFATLTRQTQVERFLDRFAFPSVFDRLSADHFAEQTRTPARRMLLLHRHHVTRAHRSAMMAPAHTRADATLGRFGKTVLVVGILEISFDCRRIPTRAES